MFSESIVTIVETIQFFPKVKTCLGPFTFCLFPEGGGGGPPGPPLNRPLIYTYGIPGIRIADTSIG